jgi:putative ABC transport system substrate-binding protein
MIRRTFLAALTLSVLPLSKLSAQGSTKVRRIGFLTSMSLRSTVDASWLAALKRELGELGYVEGKNLSIVAREADGIYDRLPSLANELVASNCDVIVAVATPAIAAAQRATSTIPIVMSPSTDPIGSGFVKSFAHPGGNITGIANMFGDLTAKSLEILHSIFPNAKQVAVLMSANPTHAPVYQIAKAAAESLGLNTVPIIARLPDDLETAFKSIKSANCDALFVPADPVRLAIVPLAATYKIPALYQINEFVDLGGLASYGPRISDMFRRAAHYVDKILKGDNPTDLPVEQPTHFALVVNLSAAKALGISIPNEILIRADEVIE